jgi:2-polyprenyl-6-methoxyphenol hydroxylase-like FAD-dependent oxidoreductase
MHIAIIGSGISGLSLYLWLQKLGLTAVHSVTIYEARSATPATAEDTDSNQIPNASFIGGALGFSPIGLRILRRLDPELEQEILRTGHWMGRWKLSNARGWFFGETQVAENGGGVLVGRAAFWQCLRRRVPDFALIGLKKVLEVLPGDARQGSKCKVVFEDGAETQADLVAGCDGVWSRVRTAVLGEEVKPIYHGLTGVGGFVGSDKLEGVEDGEMNVVFGANGFFEYGYSSSQATDPQKHGSEGAWWSTYSLAECPPDWRKIDRDDAKRQLVKRHGSWKNTVVQRIIEKVEVNSVYPTFTTPDLATWENGGCVILGDAAHALQPSM